MSRGSDSGAERGAVGALEGRRRIRTWAGAASGLAALAAAGILLAVLPHAVAWAATGRARYLADGDELLYRAWSRTALRHGEPRLTDAVHPRSGPMMHPWLIFVPPALLARGLGLGINGLAILWRVLAGAGVALGLFAAVRPAVRDRRVALGVAALLTFDAGLLFGLLYQRDAAVLIALARGSDRFFEKVPEVMAHLRVVPPGLALPFLLAHYGLVLRARISGGSWPALGAAASFGLLFYVYFYFWTAVLAGAVLTWVLDPKGRRLYATVLAGGLLLGAPVVVAAAHVRASTPPDWLQRTDKGVPIGRLEELLLPRLLIAEWLAAGFVVFRRRRELTYLWCIVGAALLCANHQLVSRSQLENFHWLMAVGVTFSVLLADLFAPWLFERGEEAGLAGAGGRWRSPRLLAVLLAVQVPLGLFLRWQEATRSAETRQFEDLARSLRRDAVGALPPGSVVAGDPDVLLWTAATGEAFPLSGRLVEFSSLVTDGELDERLMLNLFLQGTDRSEARRLVDLPAGTLGWEALARRDAAIAQRQRAHRRHLIEDIWDNPPDWIAKFGVTHVIVPAPAPAAYAAQLTGLVRPLRVGRRWMLWGINGRGVSSTSCGGTVPRVERRSK